MNDETKSDITRWCMSKNNFACIGDEIILPTELLDKYKAVDRYKYPNATTNIEALREDIKKNGINSPVFLDINLKTGFTILSEGNNRLAIAKELRISKIPTNINLNNRIASTDDIYNQGNYIKDKNNIIALLFNSKAKIDDNIESEVVEKALTVKCD